MNCPACGFEQQQGAECLKCGVVISKYRAKSEPMLAPEPELRSQDEIANDLADHGYTPKHERDTVVHHDADEDEGFFTPEKRGLEKGIAGGLVMMAIAVIWFGLGWAAGYIFFYPPVLFVIGLFGTLKGMFAGNVAG